LVTITKPKLRVWTKISWRLLSSDTHNSGFSRWNNRPKTVKWEII